MTQLAKPSDAEDEANSPPDVLQKISKTQRMPSLQPCSAVTGAFERPVRSGCNQIDEEPQKSTSRRDAETRRGRVALSVSSASLR